MQAPFEMTDGRTRLRELMRQLPPDSPHWNEAQNRFQFIDRLLVECLGWEHPNLEVESIDGSGGKADYVLGRPAKAVLEAKREAVHFGDLPIGKPSIVRKLRPLVEASPALKEAVLQVLSYCTLKGAQLAIACNGPQMVVFQAIVIGQSPLDGECYLFNGLDSYTDNFHLLWNLLSPEGVSENRAYRDLALHRNPRIPAKASTAIPEPMKYRYRNQFQENLRSLASILLEDIEEHPSVKTSFYRECYVPLEANNRHLLVSKNIINARYRRASGTGSAPAEIKSSRTLEAALDNEDVLAGSLGARPIVVVGDVGVGKTSFFENLYTQLDDKQRQRTIFIHINLGTNASLADSVKDYVLDSIPETLKLDHNIDIYSSDFVDSIYHGEIESFDRGIYGPLKQTDSGQYLKERIAFLAGKIAIKDRHLQAALGHIAHGRNKQIVLIIDNADQRRFEVQQDAFLIAQEIAATRNVLVFVALRPSTFYRSKLSGALSGYQNRVLTISPPPADEVLQRRIAFALRVAEGKVAPGALAGIKLHLNSIVMFLRATLRSIRDNGAIRTFLSNITGGNTRLAVELMTGFCGSPNVDSSKIVNIEAEEGNYKVPIHEFTKHALLGEYAYYNPQSSFVACNIFDVTTADPREHFLASLIIAYLICPHGVKDHDGFVTGARVLEEMMSHGFLEDQVRLGLRRLAEKRLIETPHAHFREIEVDDSTPTDSFHYRATSIGIYHVMYWTGSFPFLDAVSTDTPIFDSDARQVVFKYAASVEISERLKKTEAFRKYLEAQWHLSSISANYYDFMTYIKMQEDSFKTVRGAVDKFTAKGRIRR